MANFFDQPTAIRPGEELDTVKLEAYLRGHFEKVEGPLQVRQYPSGHSNLTYLLHLGDRELVLRRPPFGSKVKSAHDMGREYRGFPSSMRHTLPLPKYFFTATTIPSSVRHFT